MHAPSAPTATENVIPDVVNDESMHHRLRMPMVERRTLPACVLHAHGGAIDE